MLALERQSNTEYRQTVQQLSLELQTTAAARDELQERLNADIAQVESATSTADSLRTQLAEATRVTEVDREKLAVQLGQLEDLQAQIVALTKTRDDLELQIAGARLEATRAESGRAQA